MIKWESKLNLDVDIIDKQHKMLIYRYNKLVDVVGIKINSFTSSRSVSREVEIGLKRQTIGYIIDDLIDYTAYHFHCEERFQELVGFPGIKQHKIIHENFVRKVKEVRDQFNSGQVEVGEDLLDFLKSWILNHILKEDVENISRYVKGLNSKKMKKATEEVEMEFSDKDKKFRLEKLKSRDIDVGDGKIFVSQEDQKYDEEITGYFRDTAGIVFLMLVLVVVIVASNTISFFLGSFMQSDWWYVMLAIELVNILVCSVVMTILSFSLIKFVRMVILHISMEVERSTNLNFDSSKDGEGLKFPFVFYPNIKRVKNSLMSLRRGMENITLFIPFEVAKSIVRSRRVKLSLEEKYISLMFVEIIKFNELAEKMTSLDLVKAINQFFSLCDEIVIVNGGVILNYIGDGLMIAFNIPKFCMDHEYMCAKSALEMVEGVKELNNRLIEFPDLEVHIGMDSGKTLVGNIGSEFNMRYTCIGDFVNSVSRFQGANKTYMTDIICGETLYGKIKRKSEFSLRWLDIVRVKGKSQGVNLFSVKKSTKNEEKELRISNLSRSIRKNMLERRFSNAIKDCEELVKLDDQDFASKCILERIKSADKLVRNGSHLLTNK